jgi:hypothetical protein
MSKVIIWDEASMISRHIFDAVNRTFEDIIGDWILLWRKYLLAVE